MGEDNKDQQRLLYDINIVKWLNKALTNYLGVTTTAHSQNTSNHLSHLLDPKYARAIDHEVLGPDHHCLKSAPSSPKNNPPLVHPGLTGNLCKTCGCFVERTLGLTEGGIGCLVSRLLRSLF